MMGRMGRFLGIGAALVAVVTGTGVAVRPNRSRNHGQTGPQGEWGQGLPQGTGQIHRRCDRRQELIAVAAR